MNQTSRTQNPTIGFVWQVIAICVGLVFGGCSSGPQALENGANFGESSKQNVVAAKPGELQIFFSAGRFGKVEKCGCSMRPLGGFDREWNALKTHRASENTYYLASGPTFPFSIGSTKALQLKYQEQARVMLEAMSQLGVSFYGVASLDLLLGVEFIQSLSSQSKVPFISANIVDKKTKSPLFKPYVEFLFQGRKVLVTSLTGNLNKKFTPRSVEIMAPDLALKKVLAEAKGAFVVVISQLPTVEQTMIEKKFPEIRLILGGDGNQSDLAPAQENATLVRMKPDYQGKVLSVIHLAFNQNHEPTQLYSEETASYWQSVVPDWEMRLEDLTSKLRIAKKSKVVEEWEREVAALQDKLTRAKDIVEPREGRVNYRAHFLDLDSTYEGPENVMSAMIKRFHAIQGRKE